jgi:Zn-finger nucleic acid-binding protein
MQCPICQLPLNQGERAGIALEFCAQCGGAWLDLFQLDLILYRSNPGQRQETEPEKEESKLQTATTRVSKRHK